MLVVRLIKKTSKYHRYQKKVRLIMKIVSSECFAIIPENMTIPIAIFLDEDQALQWGKENYGNSAVVRLCQNGVLYLGALLRRCNNQQHQQQPRMNYIGQT